MVSAGVLQDLVTLASVQFAELGIRLDCNNAPAQGAVERTH